MRLTEQEAFELRRLRQSLNDATHRVGDLDMQMARLEALKQEARRECARLGTEFQSAAQRAGQAHGVDPQKYNLDVEAGAFTSKTTTMGAPTSIPKTNGKKNGSARA